MPKPEVPEWLEVRATVSPTGPDGSRTLSARLATYDQIIRPFSAYGGQMRLNAGAIERPAALSDVKLQLHHDDTRVIGMMTGYEADESGVTGTFRLARTQDADEAYALARDGILDAVSMGFTIHDAAWATVDDEDVLDVTRASLFEVSLVGRPADSTARISAIARKAPAVTETVPEKTVVPAPPAEVATLSDAQMDTILERVRANLAPAQAMPVAPPSEITRTRLVDGNGNPIVLASDRRDLRIPAAFGRDGKPYTAGDYFSAYARGVNEGDWTREREIRAALADELTSDIPGLMPKAIVGELLGRANGRRPVFDSLTERAMPMIGESFSRPRITQHVKVDPQTAQKTEVASQKFTVALADVTKKTLAGALDVSQQALDWSSPSLLNELIIDFTRIYIARTDTMAATDLVAAATAGAQAVTWDGTAATFTTALAEAAGKVYTNAPTEADAFPNTVWLSVDMWVLLAGLTDADGRPLLPQLSPSNATGTTDLSNPEAGISGPGFRWVISKKLPAKTFIVGDREYTESYENGRRFLQAVRPDVLGLDIAYMGYVATYFPYPTTLVKINVTAPAAATTSK